MEKDQSIPIAVRIPLTMFQEIQLEISDTKQNLSEWFKEAIEEKLYNENKGRLKIQQEYHESIANVYRKKIELFDIKKKQLYEIPKDEVNWLIETKKILFERPEFLKGKISLYKNKFFKNYRISEQEFYELMDRADEVKILTIEK